MKTGLFYYTLFWFVVLGAATLIWAQEKKSTPKKKATTQPAVILAFPPKPAYPPKLQDAIDQFNKVIATDAKAVKKARKSKQEKVTQLSTTADEELLALLKTETKVARENNSSNTKELEDFIAGYAPNQTGWSQAPSSRLKNKWDQYKKKIDLLESKEQREIDRLRKTLGRKAQIHFKPVLKHFDLIIQEKRKLKQKDVLETWEKEKEEFESGLQRYEFDPNLLLLLTFDRDTIFQKEGQYFAEDLSGRGHHCKLLHGKLAPSPRGGAFSTSSPTLGGTIPSSSDFLLNFPEGSTVFARFNLPPNKMQKNKWSNHIVCYGSWCIASPGASVNSIMGGYSFRGNAWYDRRAYPEWNSLIWINDPKNQQQRFWINGKPSPKTHGHQPVKPGPFIFINNSFIGSLDELRIYRGILSPQKMVKLLK